MLNEKLYRVRQRHLQRLTFVKGRDSNDARMNFVNRFHEPAAAELFTGDPSFRLDEVADLASLVVELPAEFMIDADLSFL